jgi:hypothetical protein
MKQWNRGAAVVLATAVGLAGAIAAVTPAANANTDGTTYAAIAYSPTTGKAHMSWNKPTQPIADNDAVVGCNAAGATDCVVAAEGNYCVSLATMPDPHNNAPYSGGHGTTLEAADQMALSGLAGSTIQGHHCND